MIITSLISWGLVPSFACDTSLPACSQLPSTIAPSASTCCTKASNYGWRYALFTLGGLSVFAFVARFFLFTFHESPKFLVAKGRDAAAVAVVHAVARANGGESALALAELEDVDERFAARDRGVGKRGNEGEEAELDGRVEEKKRRRGVVDHVGHLKVLFGSAAMVRLTLLTWVCYAADYW